MAGFHELAMIRRDAFRALLPTRQLKGASALDAAEIPAMLRHAGLKAARHAAPRSRHHRRRRLDISTASAIHAGLDDDGRAGADTLDMFSLSLRGALGAGTAMARPPCAAMTRRAASTAPMVSRIDLAAPFLVPSLYFRPTSMMLIRCR